MNLKLLIAACSPMVLAGLVSLAGCSGDECSKAADQLADCLPVSSAASGTTSTTASTTTECSGQSLCIAQCINGSECDVIKDAFSANPTTVSAGFFNCTMACKTAASP